ncbi:hypothetical protein [Gordonia zhaorongruii]|uniref:hypothetical protein n=1 Tax=Gordonia zhaorongruii TaxID=2597659 RepID=UPI00164364BF|nr:hypothetical protein [Gordonia zhaorongruii]
MQQSRLIPFATISAAATAIALTALPWVDLKPLGLDISWNGLAMSSATGSDPDIGPAGRGWLVIAACVVALLAALISLMPAPSARPFARLANVIAAVAAFLGALVPMAVMIWPQWYYGDLLDGLGLNDNLISDLIPPSKPILVILTIAMLITAAMCAYAARSTTPSPDRPSPNRQGPASSALEP